MHVEIDHGLEHLQLEVPEGKLVASHRPKPAEPLTDPAAAVRAALETPLGFPALRRALTPDDHVAVFVDERLPRLAELLTPLLEHLVEARIAPDMITLIGESSASGQPWVNELPDTFQDVHVEVHDASDRRKLSYLATTRAGRRIYLNRTAVDADQLVVLSHRGYDPLLGYSGAEGAIYPALSDEATRQELLDRLSLLAPGTAAWPVRQEAAEVAWLLGAPFFVQVIEGPGGDVLHVLGGLKESSDEGQRLLDAQWRITVEKPADLVIASLGGDPAQHDFGDLARALAAASRVVQPGGKIVLLTGSAPVLGPGSALLRQAEDAGQALELLRKQKPPDMAAAFEWASAAQRATLYLYSGLPEETVEELFTVPLDQAGQVQRLINEAGSYLVLNHAHQTMAVVEDASRKRSVPGGSS
jgi:nickel-dependent lactate racemase